MNEASMAFIIYLIHELANSRNMTPGQIYRILKNCGCIDNYLVPNYDVLHTMDQSHLLNIRTSIILIGTLISATTWMHGLILSASAEMAKICTSSMTLSSAKWPSINASCTKIVMKCLPMIAGKILENIYQESLEGNIIQHLAKKKNLSLEDAMDAYYKSRLSEKIHAGKYGVQYLDYRNLVRILIESELFE